MNGNLISTLRQNHALEHATISLLTQKVGLNVRMVGRTTVDGFYVYGDIPTEALREAATEGLARLRGGEQELAVSPFCGTNLAVAGIMAGVACLLALGGKDRRRQLPRAILIATWAIIAAQPIGRIVQKYVTTSPNLSNVTIKRITRRGVASRILHKIEIARG
jgi:hypothetical protein